MEKLPPRDTLHTQRYPFTQEEGPHKSESLVVPRNQRHATMGKREEGGKGARYTLSFLDCDISGTKTLSSLINQRVDGQEGQLMRSRQFGATQGNNDIP